MHMVIIWNPLYSKYMLNIFKFRYSNNDIWRKCCIYSSAKDTLNGTKQNIFHYSFSILMNSNRTKRFISNRYAPQIIYLTYLLKLYLHLYSRKLYMASVCVSSTHYRINKYCHYEEYLSGRTFNKRSIIF